MLRNPIRRPCDGSGKLPLTKTRFNDVGICPGCGVRTFLDDGHIQVHKASSHDGLTLHRQPAVSLSGLTQVIPYSRRSA